jgi:hypothetical protein
MQEKNREKVKNILLTLANHLKVKKIKGLAKFLEQDQNKLYSWIHHGNIADTGCILSKIPYISLEWLKTGREPMMVLDAENFEAYKKNIEREEKGKQGEIIATIEPGKKQNESPGEDDQIKFSIAEMVTKTVEILESKTLYKQALSSNINAFHKALMGEQQMENLNGKIERMEKEMHEMKQLLVSLGATLPRQKREEIVNG